MRNILLLVEMFIAWQGSAPSGTNGWMLVQQHELNGKQIYYITQNRVRIDNANVGYSIIADNEKQTVVIFNDNRKLRYTTGLKNFTYQQMSVIGFASGEAPLAAHWTQIKDGSGGPKTQCYETIDTRVAFSGSRTAGGYLAGKAHNLQARYKLFVTKEIALPKPLLRVICQWQGTANFDGIPIKQITTYSDSSDVRINFQTREIKSVAIDPAKWQVPSSYAETHKLSDITSRDSPGVEDLLGN